MIKNNSYLSRTIVGFSKLEIHTPCEDDGVSSCAAYLLPQYFCRSQQLLCNSSSPLVVHWIIVFSSTPSPRMQGTISKSLQFLWHWVHFGAFQNFAWSFFLCLVWWFLQLFVQTTAHTFLLQSPAKCLFSSSSFWQVYTLLLLTCEHVTEHLWFIYLIFFLNQGPSGAWLCKSLCWVNWSQVWWTSGEHVKLDCHITWLVSGSVASWQFQLLIRCFS